MTTTRKFSELVEKKNQDPAHRGKIAAMVEDIQDEVAAYTLDELRRSLGLDQEELAARLGVTQSGVSRLLRDASGVDAVRRLVEAMGGTVEVVAVIDGERTLLTV